MNVFRLLLITPSLKAVGGVANYYNSILPLITRYEVQIDHMEIGSKANKNVSLYAFKDQFKFFKRLKKSPSLVHLNPSLNLKSFVRDGLFIFQAKRKKIPVVVFFHGWEKEFAKKVDKYGMHFFNATYRRADAFIVLASEFEQKLLSWNVSASIHVETTTVDPRILKKVDIEDKKNSIRQKKIIKVLFLGRIEISKGIYETIDAVRILIEKKVDVILSVAGDGSQKASIEKYIKKSDPTHKRIRFLGYVQGIQKASIFMNHDIFCFPTYGEGLPIALLEAMAFGMPVITCAVGGIADMFRDGEMGVIVSPRDAIAIAKNIEKMALNREKMVCMAMNNYRFTKEKLTAPRVASRLIRIYREVLFQSKRPYEN